MDYFELTCLLRMHQSIALLNPTLLYLRHKTNFPESWNSCTNGLSVFRKSLSANTAKRNSTLCVRYSVRVDLTDVGCRALGRRNVDAAAGRERDGVVRAVARQRAQGALAATSIIQLQQDFRFESIFFFQSIVYKR